MKLDKNIEVGDFVCDVYFPEDLYLVCDITHDKYGLYSKDKYDGLMWYWKDDCALVKKAIYVELKS